MTSEVAISPSVTGPGVHLRHSLSGENADRRDTERTPEQAPAQVPAPFSEKTDVPRVGLGVAPGWCLTVLWGASHPFGKQSRGPASRAHFLFVSPHTFTFI